MVGGRVDEQNVRGIDEGGSELSALALCGGELTPALQLAFVEVQVAVPTLGRLVPALGEVNNAAWKGVHTLRHPCGSADLHAAGRARQLSMDELEQGALAYTVGAHDGGPAGLEGEVEVCEQRLGASTGERDAVKPRCRSDDNLV